MLIQQTKFSKTCRKRRASTKEGGQLLGFRPKGPRVVKEISVRRYRNAPKMREYRKFNPVCEYCEDEMAIDTHHIILFSDGGLDNYDNYMAVCDYCHRVFHGKQPKAKWKGAK